MLKRIYIILFFISQTFLLLGQEYLTSVRHYDLEKGLETKDIRTVNKDSQGFLWFTTELGAYRFDGYEFKNYQRKVEGEEPYSIYDSNEDAQKNIWFLHHHVGTHTIEFSILPFGGDSLVSFNQFFKEQLPHPTKKLVHYVFKPNHVIFLIYENGDIFEYHNNTFTKIIEIPKDEFTYLSFRSFLKGMDIEKTSDGKYWITNNTHLTILSPEKKIIKKEKLPESYLKIKKDHLNHIWFISHLNKLYIKENIDSPIVPAPFQDKIPDSSFRIHNNGFHNEYYLFPKGKSKYDLTLINLRDSSFIDIEPFGDINISHYGIFIEHPNSIWLTTHDGIYHILLQKKVFHNYLQGTNTSTRRMTKGDDDNLWVTSDNGLYEIDLIEKKVEQNTEEYLDHGKDMIWESPNRFWLTKTAYHIKLIDASSKKMLKSYDFTNRYPYADINFFYKSKKNRNFWVGSQKGLLKFNDDKENFFLFNHQNEFSQFDSVSNVSILELENSALIASTIGIFELDENKGFTQYYSTHNNTLPYNNIVHIHQDKEDGTFWLGTKMGGLIHWDRENNTSKSYTTENGLSDNLIYAVYEDDDGFLWLSSNIGIMRFNKKNEEVLIFTTEDGLPYDEFNYNSHYQDEDGNLYFGGLNGITTFHPNAIPKEIEKAPLLITDFEILNTKNGEMISKWKDFQKIKKIELAASQKNFRVTISLLDYENPADNQYAYKVEGLNDKWNIINGNSININDLPSGDFKLLIKAKNAYKSWTDEFLSVPIHVHKPFYLRWWFILSTILFTYALVSFIIQIRTANLRNRTIELEKEVKRRTEKIEQDKAIIEQDKVIIEKQTNELQKLDKLKNRFFANVTHELRTPLTLITSPLQRLINTQKLDKETLRTLQNITQNGEHLKDLVEEILDLSRLEGGKLSVEKKPVHFERKTKEWFENFDAIAHNRGIEYQINYHLPSKLHLNIDIKKTQKIVFNLLSNAFKFSKSGDSITLDISENQKNAIIKVIDTGEGIHQDDLPFVFDRFYQSKQINQNLNGGLGIGLALSKELALLMNGQLSVESTFGKGTTFQFEFPKETIIREPARVDKNISPSTIVSEPNGITTDFKHTILIVEDHPQMQAFVKELLAPFSNTILASNGKDALKVLKSKKHKIHLIVSDIMMPEMDGFAFLDIIKNKTQWQLIPTIMLTARADISDKLNALTIGVDDYLIKPFEPEELIARVKNLLENIELRKEKDTTETSINKKENPVLETLDSADMKWLKELETLAFEKVTTPNFNIGQVAYEMAIGERQLNRKVKKITGLTPGNYLKEIKLQKARQLLENKAYSTVAEISYLVGFNTPQYFSKIYKARFGKLPSDYFK